jgi:hypothetical protein
MLRTWFKVSMIVVFLVLLFQEWISVEQDHLVGHAATAKEVTDSFGNE